MSKILTGVLTFTLALVAPLLLAVPAGAAPATFTFTTNADFAAGTLTGLTVAAGLSEISPLGEVHLGGYAPQWATQPSWNAPSQGMKSYTTPALADLTGDGLLDLTVGKANGTIVVYRNTGTVGAPVWTRASTFDPPAQGSGQYPVPALADLNDDGLVDLAVGRYDQTTVVYQNTGTVTAPVWTRQPAWDPPALTGTNHAAPAFADLNSDGLDDLVVGANNDHNLAYRNAGGTSGPVWVREPTWDTPIEASRGWTCLAFGDLNADGLLDLFLGDSRGTISLYQNTGTSSSPVWTARPAWNPPQSNAYATPAVGNLDGDRDLDMMVGDRGGSLLGVANVEPGSTQPGVWTSAAIDGGFDSAAWTDCTWSGAGDGTVTVELRTAATQAALTSAAWQAVAAGPLTPPLARWAQLRATLTPATATSQVALKDITLQRADQTLVCGVQYKRGHAGLSWSGVATAATYDVYVNGSLTETTASLTSTYGLSRSLRGTTVHLLVVGRDGSGSVVTSGSTDWYWPLLGA